MKETFWSLFKELAAGQTVSLDGGELARLRKFITGVHAGKDKSSSNPLEGHAKELYGAIASEKVSLVVLHMDGLGHFQVGVGATLEQLPSGTAAKATLGRYLTGDPSHEAYQPEDAPSAAPDFGFPLDAPSAGGDEPY